VPCPHVSRSVGGAMGRLEEYGMALRQLARASSGVPAGAFRASCQPSRDSAAGHRHQPSLGTIIGVSVPSGPVTLPDLAVGVPRGEPWRPLVTAVSMAIMARITKSPDMLISVL